MTDVAKAYGGAIFELAIEQKCDEQVLNELVKINTIFKDNKDYVSLLSAPTLKKEERITLIDEAFKEDCSIYVVNFLKILCEENLLMHFSECVNEYNARYKELYNIVSATVTSAIVLTDEQKEKLNNKLCTLTGKKIDITYKIDESLIGGINLQMEDNQFDGSVKNRLNGLKNSLFSSLA